MIWLAALPTHTALDFAMSGLLKNPPVVLRTFVVATIAVLIVMYGLMPRLHQTRARLLASQVYQ